MLPLPTFCRSPIAKPINTRIKNKASSAVPNLDLDTRRKEEIIFGVRYSSWEESEGFRGAARRHQGRRAGLAGGGG
jgi:hypothetical protein